MPRSSKRRPPIAKDTGAVPYGQGQALADAQRQMPVRAAPGPAPVPTAPTAAGPPPAAGGGGLAEAVAAAQAMAPPSAGGLAAPTGRPEEPVTAGLSIGPGAGAGAVGMPMVPEDDQALRALLLAYQRSGSPAVGRLIELVRNRSMARHQTLQQGRAAVGAVPAAQRRPL